MKTYICTALLLMFTVSAFSAEPEFELVTRDTDRLGYGLFYDYWDFNAKYSSSNGTSKHSQTGDISGDLNGVSLQIFEISSADHPLFFEFSYRRGDLTGIVETTGPGDYSALAVTTRSEIEVKLGTRLFQGPIALNGNIGGLYIYSDSTQYLLAPPGVTVPYDTRTYMGTFGLDTIYDRRIGRLTYGLRWDNQFLLGMLEGNSALWGYDSRATVFSSYLIEFDSFDLSLMAKGGVMLRDYFGQDTSHSDAAEVYGLYLRMGVALAF